MQKKIILIIASVAALLLAGAGAWYYFTRGDAPEPNTQNTATELFDTSAPNEPAPTQSATTELPDVVARVNGQDISKAELEASEAQILASQGIDPTTLTDENRQQLRLQALDTLVSNTLIRQAAAKSAQTVSEEEISAQLETIKGQFEDPAKYQEALDQQGMTEADFRKIVASDLSIQKYLESTLNLKAIDVSEEELAGLYAKEVAAATSTTQPLPPLEEIHDQFKAFIVQQRQQQKIVAHIQELSKAGTVEVLI